MIYVYVHVYICNLYLCIVWMYLHGVIAILCNTYLLYVFLESKFMSL